MVIDFDDIDAWHPELAGRLASLVPPSLERRLKDKPPEFVDEALPRIYAVADRDTLIAETLRWISDNSVVAYHGTRLTSNDVASVRSMGLMLLSSEQRRGRLVRALSMHPRWPEVAGQLDDVLMAYGEGQRAGGRINQVHLTFSRAGLVNGFGHYVAYGSEFDQHAAHALLGDDSRDCLAKDGEAFVLRVVMPGDRALEAAHPIFSVQDMLNRGETPHLVRPLLEAWSYRFVDPTYRSAHRQLDAGLRFKEAVPSDWIVDFQRV